MSAFSPNKSCKKKFFITLCCICPFTKWQMQPFQKRFINPFKPDFTIVIFIHYKPRIAVAILDL